MHAGSFEGPIKSIAECNAESSVDDVQGARQQADEDGAMTMEEGRCRPCTCTEWSKAASAAVAPTERGESPPQQVLDHAKRMAGFALAAYHPEIKSSPGGGHPSTPKHMGIIQAAGISKEDLLYVSPRDAVLGNLPYFIALDREHEAVVIAFRGTYSVADVFTDAVALPQRADVWLSPSLRQEQTSGERDAVYVHSGVLSVAQTLWTDMVEIGLVQAVAPGIERTHMDAEELGRVTNSTKRSFDRTIASSIKDKIHLHGWQLVTTGHSLGAGVAVLIALRFRESIPGAECWAFSPPGGLCSPNLASMTASFCHSLVLGKDIVPRASAKSLNALLDALILTLGRSRLSTLRVIYLYLSGRVSTTDLQQILRPEKNIPDEAWSFLQRFRSSSAKLPDTMSRTMLPPGKVVLLRRLKHAEGSTATSWEAVNIQSGGLAHEGIVVSKRMFSDHSMDRMRDALHLAARPEAQNAVAA
ncbi:hypothetical protein CVIRNUC_006354 [Coccomyxa viridis]|uniref:sn-1-specific diacylglycerol lipase n=1 Tax=Coccomyxa viridis TaxID=1274662 RepID=A0AAV1IAV1_9CHLO|nr:hypothetical protein CVIRNUC_006354 [Coccomyxa viridis]